MITVILLAIILMCLSYVCRKTWFNKQDIKPPDLSGRLPIVGHGLRLIRKDRCAAIIEVSEECLRKGGVVTAWVGFKKLYFITDPEVFLMLSNTCLEKHYMYKFTKPLFGDGLVTADELTWKRHRKLMNPTFGISVINAFLKAFNDRARTLVNLIYPQIDEPYIYKRLISAWNLESLCVTTLGANYSKNRDVPNKHFYLVNKLLKFSAERMQKIWLHYDFFYKLSNVNKEADNILKEFNVFLNAIIHENKNEIKATTTDRETHKPFLEHMLNIKSKNSNFTDEQIRCEVNTIISAGFDSTATILNISLIILGSYPEMQQRVYDEIVQVLNGSDRDVDKGDLPKLLFTEAVLKETLRLYPPAPVIARSIDKDIKLKNYTLKKNTTCMLSIYGLNRNPNWGPDADQYRPERWLDAATLPDHNNLGTFSVGKRNCIGKAYALAFMKTVLVHVIRRYRVSADISQVVFKWSLILAPVSGHHLTFTRRDFNNSSA